MRGWGLKSPIKWDNPLKPSRIISQRRWRLSKQSHRTFPGFSCAGVAPWCHHNTISHYLIELEKHGRLQFVHNFTLSALPQV